MFVLPQHISWPACLLANIARVQVDPVQMIRFNVSLYVSTKAFLTTSFANWSSNLAIFPVGNDVRTFLHHWLHFFFQISCLSFFSEKILNGNRVVSFDDGGCVPQVFINLHFLAYFGWSFLSSVKIEAELLSSNKLAPSFFLFLVDWLSFWPVSPFNCSSSAMARKDSKFSWETFASPKYRKSRMAEMSSAFIPLK